MHLLLAKTYIQQLQSALTPLYDEREAKNIANALLEFYVGKNRIRQNEMISSDQFALLNESAERLMKSEPLQYVIGEAWFYERRFIVNRHVLIPRPETEELAALIINENKIPNPVILDIGTGSGCIAITLQKEIAGSIVYASDISVGALEVAKQNSIQNLADIHLLQHDILQFQIPDFPDLDMIVSNPPYIDPADRSSMHQNVTAYEPSIALFGDPENQLIFYEAIAQLADLKLKSEGLLYLEIPENKSEEVQSILHHHNLTNLIVRKDMQGKWRMLSAQKKTLRAKN